MTDRQLHDELITLLVAGTETAAGGLAWLFHELGRHPLVDQRLHQELRDHVALPLGPERLARLEYTRRVVDEALRVRNPGGITIRRATTDVELGGYRFPRGTEFIFSALVLHRNPRYFPHPLRFDPDRWLPDRPPVPRGAFVPFGAGSHLCIGESFARTEMMTVVAAVAGRWRLAPAGTRRHDQHQPSREPPDDGGTAHGPVREPPGRALTGAGSRRETPSRGPRRTVARITADFARTVKCGSRQGGWHGRTITVTALAPATATADREESS